MTTIKEIWSMAGQNYIAWLNGTSVARGTEQEVRDTGDYKKGFADGKASGKQTDWRGASVAEGMKLARGIFALRGNHSEIHLSEAELATQLALAFEHGVRAAARRAKGDL